MVGTFPHHSRITLGTVQFAAWDARRMGDAFPALRAQTNSSWPDTMFSFNLLLHSISFFRSPTTRRHCSLMLEMEKYYGTDAGQHESELSYGGSRATLAVKLGDQIHCRYINKTRGC